MAEATKHVVRQGECLAKIAARYGFADYRTVYEDPANSSFRKKRPNPNLIFAGDVVAIPAKKEKELVTATGKVHRFVVHENKKLLRVRILDAEGKPVTNETVAIALDGPGGGITKKTNGKGVFELPCPTAAKTATVGLRGRTLHLDLSHLNPADETPDEGASAVQGRLRNLGYYAGPLTGSYDRATRLAIWLFQFDHDLKTTGAISAATMKKLHEEHGC